MKFSNLFNSFFPFSNIADKYIKLSDSDILKDLHYCGQPSPTSEKETYFGPKHDTAPIPKEEINAIIVDVESGLVDKYHYSGSESLTYDNDHIHP